MNLKKEIKHIKNLGIVLKKIADEVEKKGHFDDDDLDLLKKVGSDIVFKACAMVYLKD